MNPRGLLHIWVYTLVGKAPDYRHAFLSRILTRSANLKDQDVLEKHDNNDTREEKNFWNETPAISVLM